MGATPSPYLWMLPDLFNTINDVDVAARIVPTGLGSGSNYKVTLKSPEAIDVVLKDYVDPPMEMYDQETTAPGVLLDDFVGGISTGNWTLTIQNNPEANKPIDLTLERFDMRLHHEDAPNCAP